MSDITPKEQFLSEGSSTLISNFKKMREMPIEIPENVMSVGFIVQDGEKMFDTSKQAWMEAKNALQHKILENDSEYLSDEEVALMSAVRKFGLVHKTSWLLIHGDHMAPSSYHELVKRMGEMKDESVLGKSVSRSELLTMIENERNDDVEYKPISWESFMDRFGEILSGDFLQEDELSFDEYHNLRKGLRHIGNIYQIKAVMNGGLDLDYVAAFRKINEVCFTMGNKLDEALVVEHETGNKPDRFSLNSDIKNNARSVVNSMAGAV